MNRTAHSARGFRPGQLLVTGILAGAITVSSGFAADVAAATETFADRVKASLELYKEQSARIADEKIPLLRELNALEDTNLQLREKVAIAQSTTAANNTAFDALRNELEGLKAQTEYAQRFLREYLDSFENRLNPGEEQHYKAALTRVRVALDQPAASLQDEFTQLLAAAELGLKRAEQCVGGYQFEGNAIADGVLVPGTVHVMGPTAVFADVNTGGDTAGSLRAHLGTIEPIVLSADAAQARMISEFVRHQGGPLPLDASLGNALALESSNVRLRDQVARGGYVGYAILVLGFAAIVLTVLKIFDLRRFQSIDTARLQGIVHAARHQDEAGALALAQKIGGPVGEMLELGVRNIRANAVLLEELMLSVILRRRPEVERFLPFLAITVVASPLLGLLGTVVGMIRTFALIEVLGSGDPRALSAGISEALITTEFGLMVAIPTLIVHSVCTRIIRSRSGDMERVAFEFVKTISLDATTNGKR